MEGHVSIIEPRQDMDGVFHEKAMINSVRSFWKDLQGHEVHCKPKRYFLWWNDGGKEPYLQGLRE